MLRIWCTSSDGLNLEKINYDQTSPDPGSDFYCPHDNQQLQVIDWYIPGMRNLADLKCPLCGREYYGDLQAGQALYTPLLLEKFRKSI